MSENVEHVKLAVELEQDEDGYPPETVERLWAVPMGDGRFKLDNIPFYARGMSDGDVVQAFEDPDNGLTFKEVVAPSDKSTIRIYVFEESKIAEVRDEFSKFGCESEGMDGKHLFSLSIPRDRISEVLDHVRAGEADQRWDWEEGVIRP